MTHAELYRERDDVLRQLDLATVTNAFLYSLSSRDLSYRPMLSCFVFASSVPAHSAAEVIYPSGNYACQYYGYGLTYCPDSTDELEKELVKWGGVRVDQIYPAVYYLRRFLHMPKVEPVADDLKIFSSIVDKIRSLKPSAKPRDLEKALVGVLKSNKGERQLLIDQLGIIGVLQTQQHRGYRHSYTPPNDRVLPAVKAIDWRYPVCWWRGEDGLDESVFAHYFGTYELSPSAQEESNAE